MCLSYFPQHILSNSKKVYLKGVTLKSTGIYRCEISAEEPDFKTVQGEGQLVVVCKFFTPNSLKLFKLSIILFIHVVCIVFLNEVFNKSLIYWHHEHDMRDTQTCNQFCWLKYFYFGNRACFKETFSATYAQN